MSQEIRTIRKQNKRKKRKKRFLTWILIPLVVIALSTVAYGTFLYKKAESVVNGSYKPIETATQKREEKVDPIMDNVSLLLIGVDDSETRKFGTGTRSDALMVVTFNKDENSVKMLSIPRDSYVKIPGKKNKTRINAAHAIGGTDLAIETVQEVLDIPIDYYVKMNFNAFIDVVDALDGVEVEVPYLITEQDSKDLADAITLQPGLQTLNGEETLALARTRHQDSDIYRGLRQQEILKAIIKKGTSINSLTKLSDIISAVGSNMETNLTFNNMKSFVNYVINDKSINFETLALEGSDSTINEAYYYQLDEQSLENVKLLLQTHLNGNTTDLTAAETDNDLAENGTE
ncbi:LCP family protein [Bacillus sp. 7884-1]|uniref:LCP family protein n=1 Tax=Bacillus sp. 7884-1 TaxID=2021693 RepID=UPI000BA5E576|nr:LCP family protein [Bacillus sp. 7884-1]PAE44446.1 transcriptional regulator [Bacillus sp. 7884-1]